jgi:P pilus assembly chaperone PapD
MGLAFIIILANSGFAIMSVSPYSVILDANSSKRNALVKLTNTANETKTFKISFVDFRQKQDGGYELIEENDRSSSKFIAYSPRNVTLEPAKTQTIRLQRKSMAGEPDGEYVSHLMMQEILRPEAPRQENKMTDGVQINITPLYAVTIPVIIRKGNLSYNASIAYMLFKENALILQLTRTGNKSANVNVLVKHAGKEAGILKNIRIYGDQRFITIPLNNNAVKPDSQGEIIVTDADTNLELAKTYF